MDYDVMNIAANFHHYKTKKGMTFEKLAQTTGISYHTLVAICSGRKKNPTTKTLVLIADALAVPLQRFLEKPNF